MEYLILIAMAVGIPLLYFGILQWYKMDFEQEQNQNRILLRTIPELLVVLVSEAAMVKIWYDYRSESLSGILFVLLYTVLIFMSILCMTDYWETIVPNRILVLMLLICLLEIGIWGAREPEQFLKLLPTIILGLLFCMISFGVGYLLSRGSMGSGDVKLAILLGIFLTSEYVVGTVFYGCVISALFSIVQLSRKKLTRKDQIPFVPFLYMGLIVTYFMG